MELLSNPWLIASFTFFIGILMGVLMRHLTHSDSSQSARLKEELKTLEENFAQYKTSVSEHFNKTSELVQGLTEDYVKVYQHLAEGSQALTDTNEMALKLDQGEQALTTAINKTENPDGETSLNADSGMQAPKDYAPQTADKNTEGTLSEAFSIKESQPRQATEELLPQNEPEQKTA